LWGFKGGIELFLSLNQSTAEIISSHAIA